MNKFCLDQRFVKLKMNVFQTTIWPSRKKPSESYGSGWQICRAWQSAKRHQNATTAVDSQCQNGGRRREEGKANIDTTHCKHRTEDRSELLESVESPLWGEQQRVMELIVVCPIYPQTVTSGRWRTVWEN